MVSYMDKKIKTLVNKVKTLGLQNNTIFLIVGDNGSDPAVKSVYKGRLIKGGKKTTTEFGLHVPMIATGTGILPGTINNNIIDFTDFIKTFANLANIPDTSLQKYGILDGKAFNDQFTNPGMQGRSWSYGYYRPISGDNVIKRAYVQDVNYKLYDSTNNNNFYHINTDSLELHPLIDSLLTPQEKITKQRFKNVLASMHN